MKKIKLALVALTFASITGANANPLTTINVSITNYTSCTVDFFADSKGSFFSSAELESGTLAGWLNTAITPPTGILSFDSSEAVKYVVRAAPSGTLNYYPASAECFHSPQVANLVCIKNGRNGKCLETKLECFPACPNCTPPLPPTRK